MGSTPNSSATSYHHTQALLAGDGGQHKTRGAEQFAGDLLAQTFLIITFPATYVCSGVLLGTWAEALLQLDGERPMQ